MDLLDVPELARLLLENTPREAAKETLWRLSVRLRARSVALWRATPNGELSLEMAFGIDGDAIAKATAMYAAREPGAPATLSSGAAVLAPIARPEGWWVYADGLGGSRIEIQTLVDFACFAAAALEKSFTSGPDDSGTRLSGIRAMKREQIVATLRLHEWNIARTARAMGVTRKTIYDWLEKFKIEREWVPK